MTKRITKYGLALFGVFGIGLPVVVVACYDPPGKNNQTPNQNGDVDVASGKCVSAAGVLPSGNCDDSENECIQTECVPRPTCDPNAKNCLAESTCGSTSTCMPMADNAGKPQVDLRIRRLNVVAPKVLADPTIRGSVLSPNIDLKALQCGENGFGSFNWLFRVDRAAGTLETGGAPPSADPFSTGFCFYNHRSPGSNIQVNSAKTTVTFDGNTFTSAKIEKLNVPIFHLGDVNNVIILPLSQVTIDKVTLSENDNCVGKFDTKALNKDCEEDPSVCTKWKTSAALGGYMTLEEADAVDVAILGQSLCVILTKANDGLGQIKHCPREVPGDKTTPLKLTDAQKGDYCSTTQQAGDCRDSVWLSATFAASAVKIHDGASVAECKP